MVNGTRTLIVCTRIGDRYHTTYCNALDAPSPYIMTVVTSVGNPNPVGLDPEDLPEDGQTQTKLCRWNKEQS